MKNMDFVSAVEAMLRGEAVSRECWDGETYLWMIPNERVTARTNVAFEPLSSLVTANSKGSDRPYTALIADILADDWEIVMSERSAA